MPKIMPRGDNSSTAVNQNITYTTINIQQLNITGLGN